MNIAGNTALKCSAINGRKSLVKAFLDKIKDNGENKKELCEALINQVKEENESSKIIKLLSEIDTGIINSIG